MACAGAGSYEAQRLATKHYKRKIAKQFKSRFISWWKKHGETITVNGVECFDGFRIDGDAFPQKHMSFLLHQKDLWETTQDKHFDWVKLYFNLGKLLEITDADVDAFFAYYKDRSHNQNADRLHYKLEEVTNPTDYGGYTTNKVVSEHWFDKKIVTSSQDADGNTIETVTWEKIEGDDFLDELSWELAELALDTAVWFDYATLTEITEITEDIELDEVALDAKIDELRAQEFVGYVVASMRDKIQEYTLSQSVGNNILDQLTFVQRFGGDGQYYLSIDAAMKMRPEDFMKLVIETMDFNTKLKAKYKWRKRLLAIVVVVGSVLLIASGNVGAGVSLLGSYIGSVSNNSQIKMITQIVSFVASGGLDFSHFGMSEALNLIMNVYSMQLLMQVDNSASVKEEEDNDESLQTFYKTPYDIYDALYCYDDLVQVKSI